MAQSTTAGIVTRLEQKKFVKGFISTDDRGRKIVRLTKASMDCCNDADRKQQVEQQLLLELTNEEQKIFQILLKKSIVHGFVK